MSALAMEPTCAWCGDDLADYAPRADGYCSDRCCTALAEREERAFYGVVSCSDCGADCEARYRMCDVCMKAMADEARAAR